MPTETTDNPEMLELIRIGLAWDGESFKCKTHKILKNLPDEVMADVREHLDTILDIVGPHLVDALHTYTEKHD